MRIAGSEHGKTTIQRELPFDVQVFQSIHLPQRSWHYNYSLNYLPTVTQGPNCMHSSILPNWVGPHTGKCSWHIQHCQNSKFLIKFHKNSQKVLSFSPKQSENAHFNAAFSL